MVYLNQCNASAAVSDLKGIKTCKSNGTVPFNDLNAMASKFMKTGSLKIHSSKRGNPVPQGVIQETVTVIVDTAQDNIAVTSCVRGVARNLDMPYNSIWKVLQKIIQFLSTEG